MNQQPNVRIFQFECWGGPYDGAVISIALNCERLPGRLYVNTLGGICCVFLTTAKGAPYAQAPSRQLAGRPPSYAWRP